VAAGYSQRRIPRDVVASGCVKLAISPKVSNYAGLQEREPQALTTKNDIFIIRYQKSVIPDHDPPAEEGVDC
jgi:hypothetical protein